MKKKIKNSERFINKIGGHHICNEPPELRFLLEHPSRNSERPLSHFALKMKDTKPPWYFGP
jgi:hypothetical protein